MYRILTVFLTILICTVFMGCNDKNNETTSLDKDSETIINDIDNVCIHNEYSEDVSINSVPLELQNRSGQGLGFVREEDKSTDPFDRPQTEEFRLKEGDAFSPYLVLINGDQDSKTFLVSTILDYRQVRFTLDGIKGLLHEITVPPETEVELPFRIDVEGKGAHDIQVVGFNQPYNQTLDDSFRMNLYGHIVSRRVVAMIDEDETPVRILSPIISGIPASPDVTFKPYICFASMIDKEKIHASKRQLYIDEAVGGELYRFQILLNSKNNRPATYMMIPFLDFHQVKVNGQDILITYLESDQETIIDAEILLPEQSGIHQFQIIWLLDPYMSILREEVLTPFVFGSPRIAIDIK